MTARGAARRGRFCRAAEARSQRDPGGEHRAGAVGIEPPACRSQGGGSERKAQLGALGTAQRTSRTATSPSRTAGMSSIALVLQWEWQLGALAGPGKSQIRVSTKQNPLGAVKATGYFLGILKDWHPNATEGILAELEIAVAPSVEFLGNGKQQKQQEQSWKQAPAGLTSHPGYPSPSSPAGRAGARPAMENFWESPGEERRLQLHRSVS
ncbi:uncharacterized protein LOC116437319 isoform X1 [Corvus moneduloides]|uniref:uncharacterized protein LOC116437319 isoform X1 n=1 Tax=Corvus moneduloides TaxID=1196302 RepID=UPI0013629020|nr:uncharacterized protein LOC116437319 isoform X1 [Corvus moneduloides]XP_031950862.1 uncharacterized protein LOC116437319 isoform X1 [Corvus moneduloides]